MMWGTLFGVLIALSCGAVSWWLATAMWTSRTQTMEREIALLQKRLSHQVEVETVLTTFRTLEDSTDRLNAELTAVIEKLDSNVFRLIQMQTGEVRPARPGEIRPQWSAPSRTADSDSGLESVSVLPSVLGMPT